MEKWSTFIIKNNLVYGKCPKISNSSFRILLSAYFFVHLCVFINKLHEIEIV